MRVSGDRALGDLLNAARDRSFVGRTAELALFRAALEGKSGACPIHYLHGPGGIGKSTLLRRFASEARDAGRPVVEVDGRMIAPTPQSFMRAAGSTIEKPGVVLLVDTFERCRSLNSWLREEFLVAMPENALVVIAGRGVPDTRWTSDPGWSELVQITGLRNLPPLDAAEFLTMRGVRPEAHQELLSFTGGNPLALSLAATLAVKDDGADKAGWEPTQDVIATLLTELLGDIPSAHHRRALEICSHTCVMSETLLRSLMGDAAAELFAWLRTQPYVESSPAGLFPHDVVRETLEADLRWRDPEGFAEMHKTVHRYLFESVRKAPESRILTATGALLYLYRREVREDLSGQGDEEHVADEPYVPADRHRVLELAEITEGEESAAICQFWLDRQPEAFRIYRSTRTGEISAFFAWLRMQEPVGTEVDPVVSMAWNHARSNTALRPSEHMSIARFIVHRPPRYQRASASMDLIQWRTLGEIFRADRLAWSFVVLRNDGHWEEYMSNFGMPPLRPRPQVGEHTYTLFGHDWRAQPVSSWLETRSNIILSQAAGRGELSESSASPRRPRIAVLSRPEFDVAVRDALRNFRQPDVLAENPLNSSRLVAENGGDLVRLLATAADVLRLERSSDKRHRALVFTYLTGGRSQEAVAKQLGLPFSTYRRHLTTGIEHLTDLLWRYELNGTKIVGCTSCPAGTEIPQGG